jgi:hypothetical protein
VNTNRTIVFSPNVRQDFLYVCVYLTQGERMDIAMLRPILGSLNAERVLIYLAARDEGHTRGIARFFGADPDSNMQADYSIRDGWDSEQSRGWPYHKLSVQSPPSISQGVEGSLKQGYPVLPGGGTRTLSDVETAPKAKGEAFMKPIKEMTQAELGAYVQSYLREQGIDVT